MSETNHLPVRGENGSDVPRRAAASFNPGSVRLFMLAGGLCMLVAVIAIVSGAGNFFRGLRCERWPATEGVIRTAEMEQNIGGDSNSSVTYSARISYDYQVAGIPYTSTRLAFGGMSSSSEYAQAILDRYRVGQKVPVWILYAAGGFFVLMGLFMLACHLRNKLYSKILMWAGMLTFLAIFHWVSFGPGERIGTTTSPFSQQSGANVRPFFVAFTVLIDLTMLVSMLALGIRRLINGRKD